MADGPFALLEQSASEGCSVTALCISRYDSHSVRHSAGCAYCDIAIIVAMHSYAPHIPPPLHNGSIALAAQRHQIVH